MYAVHSISQPISDYINQSNVLSTYLMGALWLMFLSVFVNVSSDVRQHDDVICTIVSLVFCFIVDYPASEISNSIYQVTSKRQRCADISFIDRNKEHCLTTGLGQFHAHFRIWVMLIVEDYIVTVKSRKSDKVLRISFTWICVFWYIG